MRIYLMFGLRMAILTYGLTIAKDHPWLYFILGFYGFMAATVLLNELSKKSFDKQVEKQDDDFSA